MSNRRDGELLIPFLTVVTDLISIELALLLAYWLRFYSPLVAWVPVTKGFPPFAAYLNGSFLLVIAWLYIFRQFKLYGARRNPALFDEFTQIFKAVALGMLVMMSASFFYRNFSYSRIVFLLVWGLSIFFLTLSRAGVIYLEHWRHRRGRGTLRTALVGSGEIADQLVENVVRHPEWGLTLQGYVGEVSRLSQKLPHLGSLESLATIIRQSRLHLLMIALAERQHENLWHILKLCEGLNVEFLMLPDLVEMMTSRLEVTYLGGLPLLRIKDVRLKGWLGISKRLFDLVFSIFGLILGAPLFLLLGILIKIDSRGPIFYRQSRIGFDGKEFLIYKFRSMRTDAEAATGPVWAQANDDRRTRVGKFLRRTSLDELPQLFNVLKGDMSLVGPRPERHHFVEKFKDQVPRYLERHRVKSGMTGWAQVNGLRGNTPIEERTKYDIFYVENWSLALDFKIILKTLLAVIAGENSY